MVGVKADLVEREVSCIVGAVEEAGGGRLEEKPLMAQRAIVSILIHLDRTRSP